jgi:hypothetical protein
MSKSTVAARKTNGAFQNWIATERKGTTAGSSTMKFKNGKVVLVDIYLDVPALLTEGDVLPRA